MAVQHKPQVFQEGCPVAVRGHRNGWIEECRGPLGPGGTQVYLVRFPDGDGFTHIELRHDQLDLSGDVTTVRFKEIVDRLRGPATRRNPRYFKFPTPAEPFVPPTATAEEFVAGTHPLDSDVLLFSAPAAVGKSTFARTLAARSGAPVLDLADVKASTNTLFGSLPTEIGSSAVTEFESGNFAVVVDALDEGYISSEEYTDAFLRSTFESMTTPENAHGRGPKLLLFGRTAAILRAWSIIDRDFPSLPKTRLRLDYFQEEQATRLVLGFARSSGNAEVIDAHLEAIELVIAAFFDAISGAIGIRREDLWADEKGQSFAGYAPVLASIGELLAAESKSEQPPPDFKQFVHLLRRDESGRKAWDVLTDVTHRILDRESQKVRKQLEDRWPNESPAEVYTRNDQLSLLAALFAGQSTALPLDLKRAFVTREAEQGYREAVKSFLEQHPFRRGRGPVNDVLGALVLTHAVFNAETSVVNSPLVKLLAAYGRLPFLWRFFRNHLSRKNRPNDDVVLLDADVVSYVISSVWADDTLAKSDVTFDADGPDYAQLRIDTGDGRTTVEVGMPLELRGEVRTLRVNAPEGTLVLDTWPGSKHSHIEFLGVATIRAKRIETRVERIAIGTLDDFASCSLEAADTIPQVMLKEVVVAPGCELDLNGGGFENKYPWPKPAPPLAAPPDTGPLGQLLCEMSRRIPVGVPLVTHTDFTPSDNVRFSWVQSSPFDTLLPRLLRALVDAGFATTHIISASKRETKMRVKPNFQWADLLEEYQSPNSSDPKLANLLRAVQ